MKRKVWTSTEEEKIRQWVLSGDGKEEIKKSLTKSKKESKHINAMTQVDEKVLKRAFYSINY